MRKVLIATAALLMGGISVSAATYDPEETNLCQYSFEHLQGELQKRTWVSAHALLARLDQIHFLCGPYKEGQRPRDIMHEGNTPLGPEPRLR